MSKILIVEDDPLIVKMYETVFVSAGMEVLKAANGKEGVELASSEHPDLILCDIMMPGHSGLDLLEEVKKNDEIKNIPVVIVTNISGKSDKKLALERGAVDFWVKKDIEPDQMIVEAKKLMA